MRNEKIWCKTKRSLDLTDIMNSHEMITEVVAIIVLMLKILFFKGFLKSIYAETK